MRILVPFLLALALPFGSVRAANTSGIEQRMKETQSQLEQTKKRERNALSALTRNQGSLNQIQSRLNSINKQLRDAQARAATVQQQLERTEAELFSLEEQLEARRAKVKDRILAIYRYGPFSYLGVILAAESFQDLINRYELSIYFIRHDLKLLEEYRQNYKAVEEKRRVIQAQHSEIQARSRAITALQSRAMVERERAQAKVRMTQEEVKKIQSDRVRLEQALEELDRLSRQLGSEMQRTGSKENLGTGNLIWPVTGRITSPFGSRYHPILRRNQFHNGLDIAVPMRTPVLAADSGVVKIAGWQGGYGWLVAIDHGRGRSTFYGHNSTLLVRPGEVVVKGQRIALSGSTGLSTGPHVHFEVRINGDPVNPLSYLP